MVGREYMKIIELTELQFKNYSNMHSKKSYKQSVEYAKLEKARGYKEVFLALVDDNNSVHAATLILEKKLMENINMAIFLMVI